MNLQTKMKNSSMKKILTTINGMPHQPFGAGLQARDIYPELKRYFYKENSNVIWKEFLTAKFGLWIDTRLSVDNTPTAVVGQWKKVVYCFRSRNSRNRNNSDNFKWVF